MYRNLFPLTCDLLNVNGEAWKSTPAANILVMISYFLSLGQSSGIIYFKSLSIDATVVYVLSNLDISNGMPSSILR